MAVIEVANVTKEFRLGQLPSVRRAAVNALNRLRGRVVERPPRFKALDDVDFRIEHGEVVGIIGHNGAGKSTLLKLLSRITVPTSGSVRVSGRVAPLIEVGAGLMGDLTGRENIYLNGTILGMSRAEIRRKFDEIVAFAELEQFIDTPLKRYSSGMQIRLGFSIATSVDSEVLLVDEVLAVGDVAFQRKCFERIDQLINAGDRTILIVGHNIRQIERMCSRVILLDHGRVSMDGQPSTVCSAFLEATQSRVNAEHMSRLQKVSAEFTSGQLDVLKVAMQPTDADENLIKLAPRNSFKVRVELRAREAIPDAEIVLGIHSPDLLYITENTSAMQRVRPTLQAGTSTIDCSFETNVLRPGVYGVGLSFHDKLGRCIWRGDNLAPFEVLSDAQYEGAVPVRGLVDLGCQWRVRAATSSHAELAERASSA